MRPPPDSARILAPWRVDCRLETELPEDSLVGKRFLLHTASGVFAAVGLLLVSWQGYHYTSMEQGIADWDQRIAENQEVVREVDQLRRAYSAEAVKVDQAFALMKPELLVHPFTARIARTRPDTMTIDAIETGEAGGVVLRGTLQEDSERASRLLGQYVVQLRADEVIGPQFSEILISSLDRREGADLLNFELVFRKR